VRRIAFLRGNTIILLIFVVLIVDTLALVLAKLIPAV
jgi:hypothetical protein